MATKKQKREALELKRAKELEETRQAGLRAQAKDRARREAVQKKKLAESDARRREHEDRERQETLRLAMLNMAGAGCGD